ncbi:PAS/PAC sensor protein [Chitinispirillum alkaliphilum]|nr:PAS/PAC sensor protein [Chitinispirillum alkaliphilum]
MVIPQKITIGLVTLFFVLVVIADLFLPLGYGAGVLYLIPILFFSGFVKRHIIYQISAVLSLFLILGIVFSPPGLPFMIALINRAISIVVLWAFTFTITARSRSLLKERSMAKERDRLLKKNRSQSEFYKTIIKTAPVGIAIVRADDYTYEYVNPTYSRIPGSLPFEMIGKSIGEVFPDYVSQGGLEIFEKARKTGKEQYQKELETYVGIGKERRLAYFNHHVVPLPYSEENQSLTLSVANEITDQVLARKRIEEAENQLRQNEEKFRNLADNISQLAWMADKAGYIFWYNKRWYDYTGTTFEQMKGWGWRSVHHPEYVDRVVKKIQHSWDTGEVWEDTFPLLSKDGEYRWFLSRAVPVRDSAGDVIRWFGTNTDITEQKVLQEQLQAYSVRFQRIFESDITGIVIADPYGGILEANDYFLRTIGYSREEFQEGKIKWTDLTPPEYEQSDRKALKELDEKGTATPYEKEYIRKDGSRVWVLLADTMLPGPHKHILAFVLDITERKKYELEVERTGQWLERVADTTPDVIFVLDISKNRNVYTNRSISEVLGYTSQEFSGMENLLKIVVAREDFEKTERFFKNMIGASEDDILTLTHRAIHKDGSMRWMDLRVTPFSRDDSGNVREIIGIARDITDLKKIQDSLLESEKKFRNLADSMPQLVWTAEPDGRIDYYNQNFKQFSGIYQRSTGEWSWTPVLHESDLQPSVDAWNRSVETGEIYQIEHRVKHADSTFHWYLSRAVPVRNKDGKVIKWYGTATNIDNIKEAQESLLKSENRLKVLNENLEDLVVQRTDQVRTLTKALTIAEQKERKRFSHILHENLQQLLLAAKMQLGQHLEEHKEGEEICATHTDEIAETIRLIEKSLQVTKATSIELNPPVLKNQGLDAALNWLAAHMLRHYKLQTTLQIDPHISKIKNDIQLMLIQMIRELLFNVVRHSGVLEAKLVAKCQEKDIIIKISDKGRGFSVTEARKRMGEETMLGLFSIEERLKLFGGNFIIDSKPGKGTSCSIFLPDERC